MSAFARFLAPLALALALIVPYGITNHTYPIPTFYSEFSALALFMVLGVVTVFAALSESRPFGALAAPRALAAPLGFAAVLVLQTFIMPLTVPSMNWLAVGYLLASLVAMQSGYVRACAGQARETADMMAGALMVGGLFAVFCQIVQLFHFEAKLSPFVVTYSVTEERRPFGNMAQANHLATYIAFALMSAFYLARSRRLSLWVWLPLSVVYSTGLALTVSRGPWLQVGVMLVAGLWMARVRMKGDENEAAGPAHAAASTSTLASASSGPGVRGWLMPFVLAGVFVAVNIAVRWANVHWQLGLAASAAERMQESGQIAPRLALWKYGWTMFLGHPWLGVGWGEFPSWQLELVRQLGGVEIANNAHDIFIDLLSKSGVIGLGVLLVSLLLWFARALAAPQALHRVYGFALLGILLMHALVEYPQQYMFFLLPAMFVIGLLETRSSGLLPGGLGAGVFAVLAAAGVVGLAPLMSDYHRAEVLYYGEHPAADYRAHPSTLFTAWGAYGAATLMPISRNDLPEKLAAHERAIQLLPGEVVLRRYAVLEALDGREDAALDTVARLQIFAKELNDWPVQLTSLYALLDAQTGLKPFRKKLIALYGKPPTVSDDSGDDDSDDSSN